MFETLLCRWIAGNCAGTRSQATLALRDFLLQNKGNFTETKDILSMGGVHAACVKPEPQPAHLCALGNRLVPWPHPRLRRTQSQCKPGWRMRLSVHPAAQITMRTGTRRRCRTCTTPPSLTWSRPRPTVSSCCESLQTACNVLQLALRELHRRMWTPADGPPGRTILILSAFLAPCEPPREVSSLLHIPTGYQFDGAFGSLDHGVASPSMRAQVHA